LCRWDGKAGDGAILLAMERLVALEAREKPSVFGHIGSGATARAGMLHGMARPESGSAENRGLP
jgi:hypothetical protein